MKKSTLRTAVAAESLSRGTAVKVTGRRNMARIEVAAHTPTPRELERVKASFQNATATAQPETLETPLNKALSVLQAALDHNATVTGRLTEKLESVLRLGNMPPSSDPDSRQADSDSSHSQTVAHLTSMLAQVAAQTDMLYALIDHTDC